MSFIKKHRFITALIFSLIIIFIILLIWYLVSNKPINKNGLLYIEITANNYDEKASVKTIVIDNAELFDKAIDIEKVIKEQKGYNPFKNRARWYISIKYYYEDGKVIEHNYNGDSRFDKISNAVLSYEEIASS